ncbi:MAG: hypothetical protein QOK11_1689, partial [Pseudonocardiales bacterium]|nr:hypothetical protein [Pseudonocardiales bacterium]
MRLVTSASAISTNPVPHAGPPVMSWATLNRGVDAVARLGGEEFVTLLP